MIILIFTIYSHFILHGYISQKSTLKYKLEVIIPCISHVVQVTTSLGPAKPNRTLTNNPSPMNLEQSSAGGGGGRHHEHIENSSKLHSEASFASEASAPHFHGWVEPPLPPPSFSNAVTTTTAQVAQGESVIPVDDMDEDCDEYISRGSHSSETLFSLKINWDIFKELGKYPLKLGARNGHTRTSSSGSSNCSELGTTMKEIFGPIKLYECTVPLAR